MNAANAASTAKSPATADKAPARDDGVARVAAATLGSIGEQISMTADAAAELGRAVVKLTDQRVRQRPWQAAAVAGCIGVLVGLMLSRR